jgi:hypothetical protein
MKTKQKVCIQTKKVSIKKTQNKISIQKKIYYKNKKKVWRAVYDMQKKI